MEWFSWAFENWDTLAQGLLAVVGGFSLLATLTPNEADNKVLDMVYKLINTLGANFGKAKNGQ